MALTPEGAGLSVAQLAFAHRLAVHGNGTRAAKETGASDRGAKWRAIRWTKLPGVQAELTAARLALRDDSIADAYEIRTVLTTGLRTARGWGDRINAARELAKLDGLYPEERKDSQPIQITIVNLDPL